MIHEVVTITHHFHIHPRVAHVQVSSSLQLESCVLFSDETEMKLFHHKHCWRAEKKEKEKRVCIRDPKVPMNTVKYRGLSLMLCGCFTASASGALVKIDDDKVPWYFSPKPACQKDLAIYLSLYKRMTPNIDSNQHRTVCGMFCNDRLCLSWSELKTSLRI